MGDGVRKKYAVIINGDTEVRHLGNVDRAIKALRAEDPQYQIAVSSPKRPTGTVANFQAPTQAGLKQLLAGIKIDDDDLLVIYITGHGDRGSKQEGCVDLKDGCFSLADLKRKFSSLKFGKRIVVMDQCYAGEGLSLFANARTQVVTQGSPNEQVSCQLFSPYFWSDQVPDRDKDGIITVGERYAYAVRTGKTTSLTQFYSPNLGLALSGKGDATPPFKPQVTEVNNLKGLQQQLKRLQPDQLALVMFSADWCELCKKYLPTFKQLAKSYNGRFLMIQAEGIKAGNKRTKDDWAKKYGINELPTVAFMDFRGKMTVVTDKQDPAASLVQASLHSPEDEANYHLRRLTHIDPRVRYGAAVALGNLGKKVPSVIPELVKMLADPDVWVRAGAALAVGFIGAKAASHAPKLIHLLTDPAGVIVQGAARRALAIMATASPDVYYQLLALLKSKDKKMRIAAISTLVKMPTHYPLIAPQLIPLLQDETGEVRASAVQALGTIGSAEGSVDHEKILSAVLPLAKDPRSRVRGAVVESLWRYTHASSFANATLISEQIIEVLLDLLHDPKPSIRFKALDSLERLGLPYDQLANPHAVVSQIAQLLENNKSTYVRNKAIQVLRRAARELPTERDRILSLLIPMLRDEDLWVRSIVVSRLGDIAGDIPAVKGEVVRALTPLLRDREWIVRDQARMTLEKLGVDADLMMKSDASKSADSGHLGLSPVFSVASAGLAIGLQADGGYRMGKHWSITAQVSGERFPDSGTYRIGVAAGPNYHFIPQPDRLDPYLIFPSVGYSHLFAPNQLSTSLVSITPIGAGLRWYIDDVVSVDAAVTGKIDIPIGGTVQGGVEIPVGFGWHF